MRGNSQLIICRSPLDGIRSIAFLAKGLACSSVCRLSFGSDIHSRMIFRRVSCSGFMLKILCSLNGVDGSSASRNRRSENVHFRGPIVVKLERGDIDIVDVRAGAAIYAAMHARYAPKSAVLGLAV